ncbi:PLP-dependent aminotransferase family protein [Sphingomonadaceae bacterium jetA1]|uniref:aminotransferase-like domain-containing protein n=1 Tax=Facivitalis istanbulensis TaxID=3075838 RepID=UPI003493C06A
MSADWLPNWVRPSSRGISRGLVEALADDIANGRLKKGEPLPSQRSLADQLGINFTTVTRAYEEARQRGLVEARGGLGTFVARGTTTTTPGLIDLSGNSPPLTASTGRLADHLSKLGRSRGVADLTRRAGIQDGRDSEAAAEWLNEVRFGSAAIDASRVALAGGVRAALTALLMTTVGTDGILLTEALTWPAAKNLAGFLGIRLEPVALDGEGIIPAAFDEACARHRPKALYCTPSGQNPTTATMSIARREQIAAIAAKHTVTIIEDDVYGFLGGAASPPPIAALYPEGVIYLGGLAKSMMSGMRVAYVVHGTARMTHLFAARLTVSGGVAPPLELALATELIEGGLARIFIQEIRDEMSLRREKAITILGRDRLTTSGEALHAWLALPENWNRAEFLTRLQRENISSIPSDAFAVSPQFASNCVRISLGGVIDRDVLGQALQGISKILDYDPEIDGSFIG